MAHNFSNFKVPVFPGINNQPTAPTAIKAGNGAHLIDLFNQFVDELETTLNSLDTGIGNGNSSEQPWKIVISGTHDYLVQPSDKLILLGSDPYSPASMTITLPENPQPLTTFSYLGVYDFSLSFNNLRPYRSQYVDYWYCNTTSDLMQFIYVDENTGWVSTKAEIIFGGSYD